MLYFVHILYVLGEKKERRVMTFQAMALEAEADLSSNPRNLDKGIYGEVCICTPISMRHGSRKIAGASI